MTDFYRNIARRSWQAEVRRFLVSNRIDPGPEAPAIVRRYFEAVQGHGDDESIWDFAPDKAEEILNALVAMEVPEDDGPAMHPEHTRYVVTVAYEVEAFSACQAQFRVAAHAEHACAVPVGCLEYETVPHPIPPRIRSARIAWTEEAPER